jgi:hypothetical protein
VAAEWSSLEAAKLIVGFLTPVVVVALGVMVTRAARRVEDAQWSSRKLVERRIELYDEMAGPLNDLFCFFRMVGHFREVEPPVAVDTKRKLDKAFYANQFLMTEDFRGLYHVFINTCFVPWNDPGHDAKLRSSVARQRGERGPEAPWDDEWNSLFVTDPTRAATRASIDSSYGALMERFAAECGVRPMKEEA